MDEKQKQWEQEASCNTEKTSAVDRVLLMKRMPLNPIRKKLLGYEECEVIAYFSKSSLFTKETRSQIEATLKRANKFGVILSANNSSKKNLEYIRLANNLGHSYKVVADDEFEGDTGLVIVKK